MDAAGLVERGDEGARAHEHSGAVGFLDSTVVKRGADADHPPRGRLRMRRQPHVRGDTGSGQLQHGAAAGGDRERVR